VVSRERVLAAAERKPSDRVPVELGGTTSGTISRTAHRRLLDMLDMGPAAEIDDTPIFETVHPDPRLLDRYGVDMTPVKLKLPEEPVVKRIGDETFHDEFGGIWRSTELYTYLVERPLKEPSLQDLDRMPWPDATDASLVRGLREEGYTGGCTQVKEAVRELRRTSQEVFVPLRHASGSSRSQCPRSWFVVRCARHRRGRSISMPKVSANHRWSETTLRGRTCIALSLSPLLRERLEHVLGVVETRGASYRRR